MIKKTYETQHQRAMRVDCPICNALVGQRCTRKGDDSGEPMDKAHKERVSADSDRMVAEGKAFRA